MKINFSFHFFITSILGLQKGKKLILDSMMAITPKNKNPVRNKLTNLRPSISNENGSL